MQGSLRTVQVGQHAPDFTALDLEGKKVSLRDLTNGSERNLLIFYRGGWCPFCNKQLATISQDYEKFKELKVRIVAVSSEEVEKGRELLKKLSLPYILLSDTAFEGIDRYGVRDMNPSEQTKAAGHKEGSLAKPSAFIIDGTGAIRYQYIGKNPSDRPKNDELLRRLGEIGS